MNCSDTISTAEEKGSHAKLFLQKVMDSVNFLRCREKPPEPSKKPSQNFSDEIL